MASLIVVVIVTVAVVGGKMTNYVTLQRISRPFASVTVFFLLGSNDSSAAAAASSIFNIAINRHEIMCNCPADGAMIVQCKHSPVTRQPAHLVQSVF